MEFCPSSEFVHQTVRQRWVRHITRTQYTVSYCLKVWLTSNVSVIITSWNCAGQNSRCLLHSDYTQACSSVKKQPPSTHHGNLIYSFRPCGYQKKKKNKKAKVLHICPLSLGVHPRMSILHPGAGGAGSWSAGLGQVSRVEHHGHVWDLLAGSGVGQLRAPAVPKLLGLKEKKQSRVSLCAFSQSLDCMSCQVHRAWARTECSERIT